MTNKGGRPLKYKTPEDLQQAIDKAFETIELTEAVPTRRWLEFLLGCELYDYAQRPKFSVTVNNALNRAHAMYEQMAQQGKVVPKIAGMYLCQNLGYRPEAQQIEVKAEAQVDIRSFERLMDKAEKMSDGAREAYVETLKGMLED